MHDNEFAVYAEFYWKCEDDDKLSKDAAGQAQTVSAATEEQSASMEEIASSSQNLAQLAIDLRDAVGKFHV